MGVESTFSRKDFMINKAQWTQKHLEELERIFPEEVGCTDVNKLLVNSGVRQVVHQVRMLVEHTKRN